MQHTKQPHTHIHIHTHTYMLTYICFYTSCSAALNWHYSLLLYVHTLLVGSVRLATCKCAWLACVMYSHHHCLCVCVCVCVCLWMTKVSVSTLKADLKSLTHWALTTESERKSLWPPQPCSWRVALRCVEVRRDAQAGSKSYCKYSKWAEVKGYA